MRILTAVSILGTLIFSSGVCHAQGLGHTYRFLEVTKNPFDLKHSATDPQALYEYELGYDDTTMRIGSGFLYKDVQALMKFYNVSSPAGLVGKSFITPFEFNLAMNLMVVQAQHDFHYKAPTQAELFQRAVQSLARLECPSFDDVDEMSALQAFQTGWGKEEDAYFSKLRDDVAKASGGKVLLSEDAAEDHKFGCGCIGAKNARITDGSSTIELVFTPGVTTPFLCENKVVVGASGDRQVEQAPTSKAAVTASAAPQDSGRPTTEKTKTATN